VDNEGMQTASIIPRPSQRGVNVSAFDDQIFHLAAQTQINNQTSILRTLVIVSLASPFSIPEALSPSLLLTLPFFSDLLALVSWNLMKMKPAMTTTQYKLYEMTEPYVAEFCQPKIALKIPHPPPPLSFGLQHYHKST
jgi:hypothetical protein